MKNRLNKKIVLLVFIFIVLGISGVIFSNHLLNKNKVESLINISELSENFIENYFEEYNEIENEDKEKLLIVISSEKIDKEEYGAKNVIEGPNNKYYLLFEDDHIKENAITKLNEEEAVSSIGQNHKMEFFVNDSNEYNSWGIKKTGLDHAMNLVSSIDADEVVVAILDTGCDVDLFNKYYYGKIKETYNTLSSDNSMYDNYGHGTHIAGTIAEATPDNVKIMPVKISDSKSMYETDILAAMEYITYYEKADVINMSFGGNDFSDAQYQAIQAAKEKNIITVAAAGNENVSTPSYPAAYDNTISIASVDETLDKSWFSNYGNTINFAAPGGMINSLMANYMALSANQDGDKEHETISGTSMATPHAASAVAILKSFNKDLTMENVIELLKNNVEDLGAQGYDYYYGYGLINFKDVSLCKDTIIACDEFNIFKVPLPNDLHISEVEFTKYNYGSINNLLATTAHFEEVDGNDYQKKLWELEDVSITGYDPYSSEKQIVTIKYLDLETTIEIQNPINYELGWEYTKKDELYYLSGYKDNNLEIGKLYFPEKINGIDINGISSFDNEASNLFSDSEDAKHFIEIIIPEGFESIGDYGFKGLPAVNKVIINSEEIELGKYSFSDMHFLTTIEGNVKLTENSISVFEEDPFLKDVTISNTTSVIPTSAFFNCEHLESITIPNSVVTISENAFMYSGLSNIVFSEKLKEIGNYAFKETKLIDFNLPDSLEKIGDYAFSMNEIISVEIPKNVNDIGLAPFYGNYLINTIKVSPENIYYDSRENSNLIIETSTNKVIQGSVKSTIPSSVRIIGEESYSGFFRVSDNFVFIEKNKLFTSLEIPEGVTTIEKNAFINSIWLEKVVLPSSITSIDSTVFNNSIGLPLFNDTTSGVNTLFGQTVLWVHEDSYAHNYALNNDNTYVIIEKHSLTHEITGFMALFDDRIYYPYETIENVQELVYTYWDYSLNRANYVQIQNYTISYQNGDSLRYGDNRFYFNFDIENGYNNVKLPFYVHVEKLTSQINIPTINLLIGEKILDIATIKENGFGIRIDGGILYFNEIGSFEVAGDYTIKGNFIAEDNNYTDLYNVDIPIHVINKRLIKNEVNIKTKISDGTTYIDPNTITLAGLDKSNYTIVSAYLHSADYIGNDALATVKIRLNDDIYEEYAFSGNQQEIELTTKMTVTDITIPKIELLLGESFYEYCTDVGCLRGYGNISFEEPGNYIIYGYYSYNDGSKIIDDILIPVTVINKQIVLPWAEITPKKYDGTNEVDYDTITILGLNKNQYNIVSAELISPEVNTMSGVKIKIKLTDETYLNYGFTQNQQEYEWVNPINVIKGTPKYEIPTNLKAKIGENLYDISLPTGFEWTSEDETFEKLGKKVFKAKYTPEDTDNYEIVENIDITLEVLAKVIEYTSSDYSGIYDGNEHTIDIKVDIENYNIKYSLEDKNYNLDNIPKFKDVGEYTIYYKITSSGYDDIIGSNKVKIYGIKKFDNTLKLKNNYLIVDKNSFNDLTKKINTYSLTNVFSHLDNKKKPVLNNTIKTGDYINIKINDSKTYEYELAYIGDVNGNGEIDIIDYIRIMKDIMNDTKLSGIYYEAADVNGNNSIDIIDYIRIMKIIMEEE